jgi:hypothetical protein
MSKGSKPPVPVAIEHWFLGYPDKWDDKGELEGSEELSYNAR